jgi:hypothetical protein
LSACWYPRVCQQQTLELYRALGIPSIGSRRIQSAIQHVFQITTVRNVRSQLRRKPMVHIPRSEIRRGVRSQLRLQNHRKNRAYITSVSDATGWHSKLVFSPCGLGKFTGLADNDDHDPSISPRMLRLLAKFGRNLGCLVYRGHIVSRTGFVDVMDILVTDSTYVRMSQCEIHFLSRRRTVQGGFDSQKLKASCNGHNTCQWLVATIDIEWRH